MKNHSFYILVLLFINTCVYAQDIENNCIRIDFESLNESTPTSGLEINEQYKGIAGVSFQLENGNSPVIARRGAPLEAFATNLGPDEAIDPNIIGEYILTDDGVLEGVDYSPLLVFFDNPLDSVSGVILDIDGDEQFEIFALDENGDILDSQLIESGDPMTGDANATPWGFNMDGCEGTIFSLRFEGSRSSGDFGLGMDNFIFCFSGVDLLQDLQTVITNIYCQGNPGMIEVIFPVGSNLLFSIDGGINFNNDGIFDDLTTGQYEILVQDQNGCSAILNAEVEAEGPTIIEELIITHTSCGLDNGSFEVIATQDEGVVYFIDAFNLQNQNVFEDVEPGLYNVTVIGPTGCSASQEFQINESEELFLEEPSITDDACQKTVGSIVVATLGGTGDLSYSIDGENFQNEALFDSLTMGEYSLVIQDEAFCTLFDTVLIGDTPGIIVDQLQTTETLCDLPIGTITLSASGGTGVLNFSLDSEAPSTQTYFESLDAGEYLLTIADEIGCSIDTLAFIEVPICPIYIPNIFTPESTDLNNEFKIYTHERQDVLILSYQLFDRWGSRIYYADNFQSFDNNFWWNGNDAGYKYSSGVYAYHIEVEYFDGSKEIFVGDITLLR